MAEHTSLLLTEGEDYWFEDDYLIALDHGYYQYGISRSYTALTEDQYSGNTTITVAGDSESHVNACVQDERTGLMWNKAPSSAVGPSTDGLLYWDDHCVQIQHDGGGANFNIGAKVTQVTSGATGIVRTTYNTGNRITLYNVSGTFNHVNTITDDGDTPGGPATVTGSRVGAKYDIWSFLRAANMAGLSGYSDWRIPNVFELISIMLFSHTNGDAEPDNAYFSVPGDTSEYVWSSTHGGEWRAAAVTLDSGFAIHGTQTEKSNVLGYTYLVRGPDFSASRPCRILATDQVKMSTGQFADDGFYRIGAEKSFTLLDDGQYKYDNSWKTNDDAIARTISNNCVQDNNTGLMWSRETTLITCLWKDPSGLRGDVYEHLRLCNIAKLGGHDDWRIPSIFEIASIMDCTDFDPPNAYFEDTNNTCWTVTPRPDAPATRVFRSIDGSIWGSGATRTATHVSYIRFVRGGSTDGDL